MDDRVRSGGLAVLTVVGVGLLLLHLRWTEPWIAVPVLVLVATGWLGLASVQVRLAFVAAGLVALGALGGVVVGALTPPTAEELAASVDELLGDVDHHAPPADPALPWLAPTAGFGATVAASTPSEVVAEVSARAAAHAGEVRVVRPEGGAGALPEEGPPVWDLLVARDGTTVRIATAAAPGGTLVHGEATWRAPVVGTWPLGGTASRGLGLGALDAVVTLFGGLLLGLAAVLGVASLLVGAGALRRRGRGVGAERPTVVP